ncbi:MAG: class I SAM-dependent DNA methyltransferase [Prevotella ruminicola]|jgi:type I restriction-modification system DNA methylase subunit|uniref:site-specific DNA-methyltransferase (adenine-specific) n=1 Tax=Xylanibacter ruminicola TaxID=839 RepID=A0A928BQK6_XYLRU|nr:class I SAM-dependent DNA methyltransferase [Prevotella sp.]MBE6265182.1 class I SAM-dependent DNA methyltransferase [Xylanibacter ruminicola]
MKSDKQQAIAAAAFAERWKGRGYEKGDSQVFWTELLTEVFGIENPSTFIRYEEQVKVDKTNFIDGHIPSTRVLIEQKSIDKDLRKGIVQSDGSLLNPFQQAKRYVANMPLSEHPKWIVTCNFAEFLVYDMEQPNGEPEQILLANLGKEYYRLQFLVDAKNEHLSKEMQVSMDAGKIVGKIYDALLKQYDDSSPEALRWLNILCVRIVFCLYAEDAEIFKHDQFHDFLVTYEAKDLRRALRDLFEVLNTPQEKRSRYLQAELAAFPYTNGGLFEEEIEIPQFTEDLKETLLENASMDFDWSEISPTIFGAVFESTLNPETRRSGGMHYTSIENIHKVIDPLFLNDLRSELDTILEEKVERQRIKKLDAFQDKLASLTFLDPACGSGNFLTETYLSLRRLENEVIRERYHGQTMMGAFVNPIKVSIQQFYGIEINDFAVTVATTALWISEAQTLAKTERIIKQEMDFLPLKSYTNIHEGNALRIDWESVVPKAHLNYIIGNPPFVGQAMRTKEQTEDLKEVFAPSNDYGKLDYVAGWFKKAANLIEGTNAEAAFVSSNSICQGESVNLFWQKQLGNCLYINFAHNTFKWTSEAKSTAGVSCVIVGFSYKERKDKLLFNGDKYEIVEHINGYLKAAPDVFIKNRSKSINEGLAKVVQGSPPADDGRLLFSKSEREELVKRYPELDDVLLPFVGSREFINDTEYTRYCLWLVGKRPADYAHIPELTERFRYISEYRLNSPVDRIQKTADKPYLFTQNRQPETDYLLIPRVSSENRRYIPIGFLPPNVIASDSAVLVYNASLVDFGIICSNVHNAWMRVVAGRLENRYRYAPSVYYNFPMPSPTENQKQRIEETAQAIIEARKLYPDKSLADMYGENMYLYPELLTAHQNNDRAVMQAYGFPVKSSFTESQCVAELFKLYKEKTK